MTDAQRYYRVKRDLHTPVSQTPDMARLSLNQMTTERWGVREAVEGCARAGIPFIGLWRHKVAELGVQASARLVREAGLRVSSLCRGGMFVAAQIPVVERGERG